MNIDELQAAIIDACEKVRKVTPLTPSITNTVTINFVANAQLAVGGSAAMVYLPDEGEGMAEVGNSMYINMGTLLPVYAETLPRTARALKRFNKPWVLDPVGIGIGSLRSSLLTTMRECPPSVVRGNASEIIALANLWELDSGVEKDGVRGVDSTDSVEKARKAAVALARFIKGAVAVSGEEDLITDGKLSVFSKGGTSLFTRITGAGCSLGGVTAVYAAVTSPLIAAVTAHAIYNAAGAKAVSVCRGPASFQTAFLDELYNISAKEVASNPVRIEVEE